jgi:hypothetical protein
MLANQITMEQLQAKIDAVGKKAPDLVKKAMEKGTTILAKEIRRKYLQVLKRVSGDLYDSIKPLMPTKSGTKVRSAAGVGAKSFLVGSKSRAFSQVYKGATHEMGKVLHHPGGQPFFIGDGGRIVYVSKNSPYADRLAKTKPHSINIPRRPFVEPARKAKLDEVRQRIADELLMTYDDA